MARTGVGAQEVGSGGGTSLDPEYLPEYLPESL